MEHQVPEMMFSSDEQPVEGVSAVKALAVANSEGQKIWTITKENVDVALSNLSLNCYFPLLA